MLFQLAGAPAARGLAGRVRVEAECGAGLRPVVLDAGRSALTVSLGVLSFLGYLLLGRLMCMLAGSGRVAALEVENAVLHRQLAVVRRQVMCPAFSSAGRVMRGRRGRVSPRRRLDRGPC